MYERDVMQTLIELLLQPLGQTCPHSWRYKASSLILVIYKKHDCLSLLARSKSWETRTLQ